MSNTDDIDTTAAAATALLNPTGNTMSRLLASESSSVLETVAQHINERRVGWDYTTQGIVVNLIWDAFVVLVVIVGLVVSGSEIPSVPLRLWLFERGVRSVVRSGFGLVQCRRPREARRAMLGSLMPTGSDEGLGSGSGYEDDNSAAYKLELAYIYLSALFISYGEIQDPFGGIMIEYNTNTPIEYSFSAEDAACIICLTQYKDGNKLHRLPCHHHFHRDCIAKWLHLKPICPLCKHVLKPENASQSTDRV